MAKTHKPQPIAVEPKVFTHEEWLSYANSSAVLEFENMKKRATNKLQEFREKVQKESCISNLVGWCMNDVILAEIVLETVRHFENMISLERDDPFTPWQAAKYVYLDIQERILERRSYYGEDLRPCSTSLAHNGMAAIRTEQMSVHLRELAFVKFCAKKLNDNFLTTECAR